MTSRGISNDEIRRRAQLRTDKAEQRKVDALNSLKTQQTKRDADQAKTLAARGPSSCPGGSGQEGSRRRGGNHQMPRKKKATASAKG